MIEGMNSQNMFKAFFYLSRSDQGLKVLTWDKVKHKEDVW